MTTNQTRRARTEDVPNLATVFDQYRVFYRKASDVTGAVSFLAQRLSRSESVIFLSETQDKITGFAQLYPLFSSTRMQSLWLLNDLFVVPDLRGMGISKALIEASKTHATQTGACGLCLETEKKNTIANQLYLATNWELNQDYNYYFFNLK
ncbi:MAG: GNAT family N-acetyltransferase [Cytophagales bacterium]|nr:MAG: GNAT family N-acetyltransferase [Cytophagales bacterium]TAF60023.1 MAG: GNAT family N-acetyltransferase [Cytophagales bacterium]